MAPPHITLSVRAVVARGEPFVAYGESFSDPRVARDVLDTFADAEEPLVVRASVRGRGASRFRDVAGDWFCGAGGAPPAWLPPPFWGTDIECRRWLGAQGSWVDAWDRCERGEWSIGGAARAGVDRRLVASAACACARNAWSIAGVPGRPDMALSHVLDVVEAWVAGGATEQDVREATQLLPALRDEETTRRMPVPETSAVAFNSTVIAVQCAAKVAAADEAYTNVVRSGLAFDAGLAVASAVRAVVYPFSGPEALRMAMADTADLVRSHIPAAEALRAAARPAHGLPGDIDAAAV